MDNSLVVVQGGQVHHPPGVGQIDFAVHSPERQRRFRVRTRLVRSSMMITININDQEEMRTCIAPRSVLTVSVKAPAVGVKATAVGVNPPAVGVNPPA
eukprot:3168717-Pyramimonas_sp.AAC.1